MVAYPLHYIGVKALAGYENNYMKTVGTDGWFVIFRLYAPMEPYFDKTFSLPNFEEVKRKIAHSFKIEWLFILAQLAKCKLLFQTLKLT